MVPLCNVDNSKVIEDSTTFPDSGLLISRQLMNESPPSDLIGG
jgi:hypothetical protein